MSNKTYKLLAIKTKTDKIDYIKSKTFCSFRESIKKKRKESYIRGEDI